MASRSLADLHPRLRTLAAQFVDRCATRGVRVLIYMTYRSAAEQDALYAKGRTAPGPRVTNARGGQSKHNATVDGQPAARAFDCCPTDDAGRPIWAGEHPHWETMAAVGKSLGLVWGGDWKTLKDKPHFELAD